MRESSHPRPAPATRAPAGALVPGTALVVACSLVALAPCLRQGHAASVDFSRAYSNGMTRTGADVVQLADGGFLVAGRFGIGGGNSLSELLRTDAQGDTLWSRTYGMPGENLQFTSAMAMDDGGFAAAGAYNPTPPGGASARIRLLRTDASGNVLWTSDSPAGVRVLSAARTADGGFLLAGRMGLSTTDDLYLLRLDAAGDSLWSRVHVASIPSAISRVLPVSDGGFAIGFADGTGGDLQGRIVRTNATGDTLWTRAFGGPQSDLIKDLSENGDGTFLACGWYGVQVGDNGSDVWLLKLTATGDTVWTRRFDTGLDDGAMALVPAPGGGAWVAAFTGAYSGPTSYDVWSLRLDAAGDTLFTRRAGGGGDDEPVLAAPTSDGGMVCAGFTESFGPGGRNLFLVRVARPGAHFDASPSAGPAPLSVAFTDRSSGAPTGWSWDFDGDGVEDAAGSTPGHGFPAGAHDVRLIASYGAARDTVTRVRVVTACGDATPGPPFAALPLPSSPWGAYTDGVAWIDYDADGDLDVFVTADGDSNRLLRNDGGGVFTRVPGGALVAGGAGLGTAWGDFDNDGDPDVFLANTFAPSQLVRNDGGGLFVDVTNAALANIGEGNGAAWADYDSDGDLDLYVGVFNGTNRMFRNDSTLGFVDATTGPLGNGGDTRGVAWGDYDGDGDPDLYVANEGANVLLRNDGGGSFADVTTGPLGDAARGQAVSWGDYDGDGDLDLFVANDGASSRLLRNDGGGAFADATTGPLATPTSARGAAWGDIDLDGDLDLFVTTTRGHRLLRNDGGGTFADVTTDSPCFTSNQASGAAFGDFDEDGDLDLFVCNRGGPPQMLRNDLVTSNHWFQVELSGLLSNASAIGARVRVVAGGVSQVRDVSGGGGLYSQDMLPAAFGLGPAAIVDSLIVSWPRGGTTVWTGLAPDRRLRVSEPGGDTLTILPAEILGAVQGEVPVVFGGSHDLGAVSLFFDYDSSKVTFGGASSRVPGVTFTAGLVGGRISVQWFDGTGGFNPIAAGEDTLFVLLFTAHGAVVDSTTIAFDRAQCVIASAIGDPLPRVRWRDQVPYGRVAINGLVTLSGRVGYYRFDRDVPGARLFLGPPVADVWSGADGGFQFGGLVPGAYTLGADKSDDTDGINALDAVKVVRHSSGVEPFADPNQVTAANVNGDGFVNSLDAIKIVRAAVGLEPLASGDWRFLPPSRAYAALVASQSDQDFTAIRMGDVNGDWAPAAFTAGRDDAVVPGGDAAGLVDAPALAIPDTTVDDTVSFVSSPVVVTGFNGVGAVSLRITFPDTVLSYVSLTSHVSGVTFTSNRVGNEVRIEWFDPTGGSSPIQLGDGTLLSLLWSRVGTAGDSAALRFRSNSAIGNATGEPIVGVAFTDGVVAIRGQVASAGGREAVPGLELEPARPNPFSDATTLRFRIPERAQVRLRVFDVRGGLVATLADGETDAGEHVARWRGERAAGGCVPPGLYFVHLEVGGRSVVHRLLRLR
jgi:PKD repeat protein